MSAWGTGILQDDVAREVYSRYLDRWDTGVDTPETIRSALETGRAHVLDAHAMDASDFAPLFWLALARAQWECGVLQPDVLAKVEKIIADGSALEPWRRAFDPRDYGRRKGVLTRFLATLHTPPARPRRCPRTQIPKAIYRAGDCLAVRLLNGDWGAALVLAAGGEGPYEGRFHGMNLVGFLRYRARKKPDLAVFKRRQWLQFPSPGQGAGGAFLMWCERRLHKDAAHILEKVGRVEITDADPKSLEGGYRDVLEGWRFEFLIEQLSRMDRFVRTVPAPQTAVWEDGEEEAQEIHEAGEEEEWEKEEWEKWESQVEWEARWEVPADDSRKPPDDSWEGPVRTQVT